jgi:hypothetical protein
MPTPKIGDVEVVTDGEHQYITIYTHREVPGRPIGTIWINPDALDGEAISAEDAAKVLELSREDFDKVKAKAEELAAR